MSELSNVELGHVEYLYSLVPGINHIDLTCCGVDRSTEESVERSGATPHCSPLADLQALARETLEPIP